MNLTLLYPGRNRQSKEQPSFAPLRRAMAGSLRQVSGLPAECLPEMAFRECSARAGFKVFFKIQGALSIGESKVGNENPGFEL
jgi:hypothetical protein